MRIKQVRKGAHGFREIRESTLEGPPREIGTEQDTVGEVGRAAGLERRHDLARKFVNRVRDELYLVAGPLLEGDDDLLQRLVLLRIEPLLPPDHEVGGLCAERRYREHRGENGSSAAHHQPPWLAHLT
jgi:hypothetical protein